MRHRAAPRSIAGLLLWALVFLAPARAYTDDASTDAATLVPNAKQPAPGVVTGGQRTPNQLRAAKDAGYRTVINLRTPKEKGTRREDVEALGMTYVALPIASAADITEQNARVFAKALADAKRPALVHCASGNRVGALFALKALYVDGKSPGEALAIGKAAGLTRLEATVRARLETAAAK